MVLGINKLSIYIKGRNMRGEQEQCCLDTVKSILKTKKNCLGCLDENDSLLENINLATANKQASKFPDFIFEGGFIEHFQVSASKETGKGSSFKQEESKFKIQTEKACQENQQEWMNKPFYPNTITTIPHELIFDENSYEYFVDSFKRNFEKHIESLKKYDGQKQEGIFLIEQTDAMIFVTGTYPVVSYSLFFDKDLLEYIYGFKDILQYIVFTDGKYLDLIKISRIPPIIQYLPQEIAFKAGRTSSTTLQVFMNIQM